MRYWPCSFAVPGMQIMQSYLPGPSTYLLSSGTGIRCRAAQERGHDIISLEVGAVLVLFPVQEFKLSGLGCTAAGFKRAHES